MRAVNAAIDALKSVTDESSSWVQNAAGNAHDAAHINDVEHGKQYIQDEASRTSAARSD